MVRVHNQNTVRDLQSYLWPGAEMIEDAWISTDLRAEKSSDNEDPTLPLPLEDSMTRFPDALTSHDKVLALGDHFDRRPKELLLASAQ